MFKFINDKDNAPSFHTTSFDFDQDVDYSKDASLSTHVNLACTQDNVPVIYLNTYGLRYKHSNKFSISIVDGLVSQHITKKDTKNDGQSDFFYLSSNTGKIKISDTFKDVFITWKKDDLQVQITTSEDDSVIIDFEKGVIDPNIKRYVDFLLNIYESAPDMIKPSMWKRILDLRNKFGILHQ